jgi:hypothetical protein
MDCDEWMGDHTALQSIASRTNRMKLVVSLTHLYSKLLHLYPGRFQNEFAEEMQSVFRDSVDEAVKEGYFSLAFVCLRELVNLPASLLRERWYEAEKKELNTITNERMDPVSSIDDGVGRWDALIGILPFLLFGVASMLVRSEFLFPYPYYYLNYSYSDLVLFVIALIGLFLGLLRCVPRWTYSYLGWSIFLAWSWMGRSVDSFSYPPFKYAQPFGWWSWLPILIVLGLVLFLTRSFRPLRGLVRDVWQDWTRLSLAMYALIGWLAIVAGYDENHHPYLFAFMSASTLAISGSVWAFLRSRKAGKQTIALISGCVAGYIITRVCDATWAWWTYHGLPAPLPEPWYSEVFRVFILIPYLAFIIFWPVLIGFVRISINGEETPGPVS